MKNDTTLITPKEEVVKKLEELIYYHDFFLKVYYKERNIETKLRLMNEGKLGIKELKEFEKELNDFKNEDTKLRLMKEQLHSKEELKKLTEELNNLSFEEISEVIDLITTKYPLLCYYGVNVIIKLRKELNNENINKILYAITVSQKTNKEEENFASTSIELNLLEVMNNLLRENHGDIWLMLSSSNQTSGLLNDDFPIDYRVALANRASQKTQFISYSPDDPIEQGAEFEELLRVLRLEREPKN